MLLVVVHLPVAGLYSSAVAVNVTLILPPEGLILTIPPATKTWPFGSSGQLAFRALAFSAAWVPSRQRFLSSFRIR